MVEQEQRVVHIKKDRYDVYVGRGRGSKWGNPYRIGDPHPESGGPMSRREVLELFREYIVRGGGRPLLRDLGELEGKTLGCFCAAPGGVGERDHTVCHGQILLKLLSWRREKLAQKRTQKRAEDRAGTGESAR